MVEHGLLATISASLPVPKFQGVEPFQFQERLLGHHSVPVMWRYAQFEGAALFVFLIVIFFVVHFARWGGGECLFLS
jgi:hypothetical protein